MVEPTGVIGLIGLFTTCLEGYKICLSIKDSDNEVKLLRTRMYLERERFKNIGKTCGLLSYREDQKTDALKQFLAEDPFRRKAIGDTLELIANLLDKAEGLDRKYTGSGSAGVMIDQGTRDAWNEKFQQLRLTMKKISWSIRDKTAYEDILKHLVGFNDTLGSILPGPLQEFLKTVLPATVNANDNADALLQTGGISAELASLKLQIAQSGSNYTTETPLRGPKLDAQGFKLKDLLVKDRTRYLAEEVNGQRNFLVEWSAWEIESESRAARIAMVSGLLAGKRSMELCLLSCAGYLEEIDVKSEKSRFALVYELETRPRKVKTLFDLLETFRTIQLPALETRLLLARNLCRAMLLYHSTGWIHHDFRSHNLIFTSQSILPSRQSEPSKWTEYQGIDTSSPLIIGFGHARDENALSTIFADKKAISKSLKQQKRYWSPDYLISSEHKRTNRSFQRSHDIYSLGCVLLEIGVWRPLESYTWESQYDDDHTKWYRRLLKEESKLRAMCGSRYAEAVMACLHWRVSDIETDVQALAFDILLKLEEIVV